MKSSKGIYISSAWFLLNIEHKYVKCLLQSKISTTEKTEYLVKSSKIRIITNNKIYVKIIIWYPILNCKDLQSLDKKMQQNTIKYLVH